MKGDRPDNRVPNRRSLIRRSYCFSKHKPESDLTAPGAVDLAADRSEGSAAKVGARVIKPGRIQEVKELTARVYVHTFADSELLGDPEVQVVNTGNAAITEIAGSAAVHLVRRFRERADVEVFGVSVHYRINTRPAAWMACEVGALTAVSHVVGGRTDIDRLSRLECRKSGNAPASDHRIQTTIHVPAQEPPTAERQLVNNREGQPVGCIVPADALFGGQIVQVLGRAPLELANPGVGPFIRSRNELREGVIACKTQPMRRPPLEPDL